jgi:hypothetical protein
MTALAAQERQFQVSMNSLWPGRKLKAKSEGETQWSRHTGAWRTETHTLKSLCQRITGDGFALCAVLKEPWRKAGNFKSIQVLATDHDGASLEALSEDPLIEDHAAFIYETPSSTRESPKGRAMFVLDRPITDPGIARLAYRALIWHFSNGAPDAAADEACKDPTRFFYGRPQAPHLFLGNVLYRDVLQEIIEGYLASGTGADLNTPAYTRTGEYDPHRGPQLVGEDRQALAKFLTGQGLKLCHDGRFNGPCLFHECNCPGAFYASSRTGSWYCFCSDHPGINHGSVGDLADVGFVPEHPREAMTWEEVKKNVAQEPVQPFYRDRRRCPEDSIGENTITKFRTSSSSNGRRKRDNLKRSALWDWCREHFPAPKGVKPKVKSAVLLSKKDRRFVIADLYSTSWLNRANEMFKKSNLLFHLIKRFAKADAYYHLVPADDWNEKKHEAVRKAVERKGGRYFAIDNLLAHGYWVYIATAQAPGFEPIEDLPEFLLKAVKGIRVPKEVPEGGRFHPTRASQCMRKLEDQPPDEDKDELALIASKRGETDWAGWEANLRELGWDHEDIDPIFRSMPYSGITGLADPREPYQALVDLAVSMGYSAHKRPQKAEVEA